MSPRREHLEAVCIVAVYVAVKGLVIWGLLSLLAPLAGISVEYYHAIALIFLKTAICHKFKIGEIPEKNAEPDTTGHIW